MKSRHEDETRKSNLMRHKLTTAVTIQIAEAGNVVNIDFLMRKLAPRMVLIYTQAEFFAVGPS